MSQKPSQKSSKKTAPQDLRDCFFHGNVVIWAGTYDIVRRGGVSMTKQEKRTNKVVKATEARDQLPQILNSVYRDEGRVVIERSGIPVAAIVSPRDLAALDRMDEQRAGLAGVLAEMREAFKDVAQEEIEAETNKAVDEVRAQMRAEREQAAPSPSTR